MCTSLKCQWAGSTFSLFSTSSQLVILQRASVDFKGIHDAPEKHNTVCECKCTQMRILLGRWEEAAIKGQMALCPLKLKNSRDKRNSLTKKKLNLGYWAPALCSLCEELLWDLVSSLLKWRWHLPHRLVMIKWQAHSGIEEKADKT